MGTRFIDLPITFGKKTAQILSVNWDAERQVADISYTDERGGEFATTSISTDVRDVRRAVLDAVISDYNRP